MDTWKMWLRVTTVNGLESVCHSLLRTGLDSTKHTARFQHLDVKAALVRDEVTEAPPESIEVTIYGVEHSNLDIATLTTQVANTDNFQSMDIKKDILIAWFMLDEEVEDIGDAVMHYLPQTCEVLYCNGNIIKIIKEKEDEILL